MKVKSIIALCLGAGLALSGCSKDTMAELNTDPSSISDANIPYLFATALQNYDAQGYLIFYYNAAMVCKWGQTYMPSNGYTASYTDLTASEGYGYTSILNYLNEIDYARSQNDYTGSVDPYQSISAATRALVVAMGIFNTDMYGSMPYSEACLARHGGTYTPKYDTQEELYNKWLEELDASVATLTTATNQTSVATQDVVYGGDWTKWAKYANSLKLKIAVRLLNVDRTKALSIAEAVANSSAGVLSGADDNFIINYGSENYHFGNGASAGACTKNMVDFMMKNSDPRMRVFFTKNDFNSEVVQSFFDYEAQCRKDGTTCGAAVPKYILDLVDYTTDANGDKTFVAWKGKGEPWVRYVGLPVEMDAAGMAKYLGENNYFNSTKWQITLDGVTKSYSPYSIFNEECVRGQITYTYPSRPGKVAQDNIKQAWYGMGLSTGEVNFYLAELKTYGANLPKSASDYFNTGLRASVEEQDHIASLNKIPYYGSDRLYDSRDVSIELVDGEIDTMMANSDYQLTGDKASDLEKIYLQEIIHFYLQPDDQFETIRRSGCPKVGSSLVPWVNLVPNTSIARRYTSGAPSITDLMYDIILAAQQEEGFTSGANTPSILNSERVWTDKGNPNFGEGPKL